MTDKLPDNWESWPLEDTGEWLGGGTPASSNHKYWNGDILWVSPKDMKVAVITSTQDTITSSGLNNSAAKLISAPAVLFVTRSGILAHSFPVATTRDAVTVNQDLKAIVPVPVIDTEYLAWTLRYLEREVLRTCSKHGTTVHSIEISALKSLNVPIPPPNEQRRIVIKIEELFSKLDKSIEALTTAREQLKAYRQSVLKHAFAGKLTEEWRQEHPENIFPRDRFSAHVKKLWHRFSQARLRGGQKAPKIPLNIEVLEGEAVKHLPTLSSGWHWLKLSAVAAESVLGKMLDKEKNKGTLKPYLANINVRWGHFDLDNLSEMRFEDSETERYGLLRGDLVICEGGEPGRCAIWRDEAKEMRIQKALHRVRVVNGLITPEFLYRAVILASELGYIQKHFTGTTIKHLTGAGLSNVEIPLCGSVEEQKLVVEDIEARLSEAEKLASEIDEGLERITALRHSILKKGFSGQLVTQDPNDEPASVLLELIRAERERAEKRKSRNSKNGKSRKKDAA